MTTSALEPLHGLSSAHRASMQISPPRSTKSASSLRQERAIRAIERHNLHERLTGICARLPINITLLLDGERVALVQQCPARVASVPRVVVAVPQRDQMLAQLEVHGDVEHLPIIAALAAEWVGDVLLLEDEMSGLAEEIVHSYEELHLLYNLGGALGAIQNVAAASALIVDAVLDPLGAVYAIITLKHDADKQTIHRSASREVDDRANLNACATASLQVSGKFIGTLAVYGKRSGGDFTSGDYKLLDGVASVSAPALHSAQLYEAACQQAQRDSLTGVYNHRRIQEQLNNNLDWARQYGAPASVIMAEIDHLDLFNDVYGVSLGNSVQRLVADCLRASTRPGDAIGSYGEDKFIVVLPNTDARDALTVARRMLSTIRAREVTVDNSKLAVRVSLGVAAFPEHAAGKQSLIAAAVSAMREAAASGGATVRTAGDVDTEQSEEGEAFSVLQGLVHAVDAKDHYTQEHSEVVTNAALLIADRLGLPEDMRHALRMGGMLHDVGKIGIPDSVLKKPGRLSPQEFEIMKQHVVLSELIVRGIPQPPGVLDAVSHHHERYDGRGYPYGKRGDQIPLLGRIMIVADAYSAMCIDRPYRKGLSWPEIRAEFVRGAGTQFDPDIVDLFVQAIDELRASGDGLDVLVPVLGSLSAEHPS